MHRRRLLAALATAPAFATSSGRTQSKLPLIGFISNRTPEQGTRLVEAMKRGLAEQGFVEGQTLAIDYQWSNGDLERLPALAESLVRRRVAVIVAGGTPQQAEAYVASVYKNVQSLPKDAREASDVFLKRDQGDVLLNYENEAIQARNSGELKQPFLVPELNIRIDGPIAVVDKNVDKKKTRAVAEAYLQYLYSDEGQEIAARNYYRAIDPKVAKKYEKQFPKVSLFTIDQAFGGWAKADKTHFADGGTFDQIYQPGK